jgi:glutamine cyclotransferase
VTANPVIEARIQRPAAESARKLRYKVVASYPHDPDAFLQGLVWQNGRLFESTGLHGQSSLREVSLKSGQILRKVSLSQQYFGEGLALANDRLFQITWQSGEAFLYDLQFKQLRTFRYSGEGWGLTFDGSSLIMSDGTDSLTFRNPNTFEAKRSIKVTLNGAPVRSLNELEYINGQIWANVWQTDYILCIHPKTGVAGSYLDLRGLLPDRMRTGNEDVLNGIAFDKKSGRILLGGKKWPRLFEIKLTPS